MVKVPMGNSEIDIHLEEQERRRKERRDRRELRHIDEEQLVEPAKQYFEHETEFLPEKGVWTWYEEPSVFAVERDNNEPPGRVIEKPDLVCVWEPDSPSPPTIYVIELKKIVGKKALGQLFTYYWTFRNGVKLVDGDREYTLSGDEFLGMCLGAIRYRSHYYDEMFDWALEPLQRKDSWAIRIGLDPE